MVESNGNLALPHKTDSHVSGSKGRREMSRKRVMPEQIIGKVLEAEVAINAAIRHLSPGQRPSISRAYMQLFRVWGISLDFGK
jgi:hypothetical protein